MSCTTLVNGEEYISFCRWVIPIGANGPRFAGTVPIFEALSPLTYKNFYCGPRFHRLWEYWRVFKNLLVLLIFDSTQDQLS